MGQPCCHPWPGTVPTSAGREAELGKELQQGFGGLVPWLAEQEGCQALPQLRLQLCFLRLPRKCLVCNRDGDSPESLYCPARWEAAPGKAHFAGAADSHPRYLAIMHQCFYTGTSWWPGPSLVTSLSQEVTFAFPAYRLFP